MFNTLKTKLFALGALAVSSAMMFAQEVTDDVSVPEEAEQAFVRIEAQADAWATSAISWIAGIVGAVIVIFLMIKAVRWVKRAINSAS